MRRKPQREDFIPAGASKVTHKVSGAVAYLYSVAGKPCAMVFHGRQQKPAWRYRFSNESSREAAIARFFDACRVKVEHQTERKAKGRGLEVGDVLKTCWGYEQTNVEWFQVTALIGANMVELRELAGEAEETGWLRGKTVPMVEKYIGDPLRRVARDGRVKIDEVRRAWKVEPLAEIGGRKVYEPASYTSYH